MRRLERTRYQNLSLGIGSPVPADAGLIEETPRNRETDYVFS